MMMMMMMMITMFMNIIRLGTAALPCDRHIPSLKMGVPTGGAKIDIRQFPVPQVHERDEKMIHNRFIRRIRSEKVPYATSRPCMKHNANYHPRPLH
jgi:hypothetical protein